LFTLTVNFNRSFKGLVKSVALNTSFGEMETSATEFALAKDFALPAYNSYPVAYVEDNANTTFYL